MQLNFYLKKQNPEVFLGVFSFMKADEKKYIYTDEIEYADLSHSSVWGTEDLATTNLLNHMETGGKWLNLCAGDGRFNHVLLEKADEVVAVDIDEGALQKLVRVTPDHLKNKLITKTMNVVEPFPFEDGEFVGVFSVGTMHLFPRQVFQIIFLEMRRVLKSGGRIIMDFAADIKRTYPDGSLWIVENEPNYTQEEALSFLKEVFKDERTNFTVAFVPPEKVTLGDKEYLFTSNFILVDAVKK